MSEFKIIPRTNGRYAMNREGTVINAKTGKVLTSGYQVSIVFEGKHRSFTRSRLMELVFGIKMRRSYSIPVTARRGDEVLHFDSLFEASVELAPLVFRSESTVSHRLKDRAPIIGDYRIIYSEPGRFHDESDN